MGCMERFARPVLWVLFAGQLAVALAMIIIPAVHLSDYDWDKFNNQTVSQQASQAFSKNNIQSVLNGTTCLIGRVHGYSLCTYAYVVGGASIGASVLVFLLRVLTCGCCGSEMAQLTDAVYQGLGTAWWAVAGVVFSKYGHDANKLPAPETRWRNSVVVLSWIGMLFFLAQAIICTFVLFSCPCYWITDRASPGGPEVSKKYRNTKDEERAEGAKARLTELTRKHNSSAAPAHKEQFLRD